MPWSWSHCLGTRALLYRKYLRMAIPYIYYRDRIYLLSMPIPNELMQKWKERAARKFPGDTERQQRYVGGIIHNYEKHRKSKKGK